MDYPWKREVSLVELPIVQIRTDGGTQQRVGGLDKQLVEDLQLTLVEAQKFEDDYPFDPVEVYDDGNDLWLVDGFHRVAAYEGKNLPVINAFARKGTLRDAVMHSLRSNAKHGLRRTNEDKRKAVATMLKDAEWGRYSDSQIAEICIVSDWLVRDVRKSLSGGDAPKTPVRIDKRGNEYDSDVAAVAGRKGAEEAAKRKAIRKAEKEARAQKEGPGTPTDKEGLDLTDDEWIDSLPLTAHLSQHGQVETFRCAALLWRHLDQLGVFSHLRYAKRFLQPGQSDEMARRFSEFADAPHPSLWHICPKCAGTGTHRVDIDGNYVDRSDPHWSSETPVSCSCNSGFVFFGGMKAHG